jgi:hypothetical protein
MQTNQRQDHVSGSGVGRVYTWDDLAAAIARMPAAQRRQPVCFVEPYDCFTIHSPVLLRADEPIVDEDASIVAAGVYYLA